MYKVVRTDTTDLDTVTMVVGIQSRSITGFIFMWSNVLSFIFATKRAEGCASTLSGVTSPFSLVMVSYWDCQADLMRFVGHKKHKIWMRFAKKHPEALTLFNETYSLPLRVNHINEARGLAAVAANSMRKSA